MLLGCVGAFCLCSVLYLQVGQCGTVGFIPHFPARFAGLNVNMLQALHRHFRTDSSPRVSVHLLPNAGFKLQDNPISLNALPLKIEFSLLYLPVPLSSGGLGSTRAAQKPLVHVWRRTRLFCIGTQSMRG